MKSIIRLRAYWENGVPEGRLAEFRKCLGHVTQETTRVGRIVSDLLSFSRRFKPQLTKADLNRIVKTTVSLVNHKLMLANVAAEKKLDELKKSSRADSLCRNR